MATVNFEVTVRGPDNFEAALKTFNREKKLLAADGIARPNKKNKGYCRLVFASKRQKKYQKEALRRSKLGKKVDALLEREFRENAKSQIILSHDGQCCCSACDVTRETIPWRSRSTKPLKIKPRDCLIPLEEAQRLGKVVGAAIVPRIARNERVFFGMVFETKGKHDDAKPFWGFVYGGIDEGDVSIFATADRELKEEFLLEGSVPDFHIDKNNCIGAMEITDNPEENERAFWAVFLVDLPPNYKKRKGIRQIIGPQNGEAPADEKILLVEEVLPEVIKSRSEQRMVFYNHKRLWRILEKEIFQGIAENFVGDTDDINEFRETESEVSEVKD